MLTQRQESQIENEIEGLINYTYKSESLNIKTFIYINNINRDEFDNAKNVIKDFHKRYLNKL